MIYVSSAPRRSSCCVRDPPIEKKGSPPYANGGARVPAGPAVWVVAGLPQVLHRLAWLPDIGDRNEKPPTGPAWGDAESLGPESPDVLVGPHNPATEENDGDQIKS